MFLKKLTYIFRDYFAFTQSETRGVLVLFIFLTVLLCAPPIIKSFLLKKYTDTEYAKDQILLDSLVNQLELQYQIRKNEKIIEENSPIIAMELFNPNSANVTTLTTLGFRPWIVERILKYRKAGGKFNIKRDLRKIYGLSDEMYQRVYDYIDLPENMPLIKPIESVSEPTKIIKKYSKPEKININAADTTELKKLKGIGTILASRITKYRDLLGGFVDTSQFAEVYGLSPEVILRLQNPSIILDTVSIRKININTADEKTFSAHPYISFKVAKAIVDHRENYGSYTKVEDLKEVYLIDDKLFAKIARYLFI